MEDKKDIQMRPVLRWAYGPKDGNLDGSIGSARDDSPFPEPVSGDHYFATPLTLSINLSGNNNE